MVSTSAELAIGKPIEFTESNTPMTAVGTDAIEIWMEKPQLDLLNTFAPKKGDNPEKYTRGRPRNVVVPGRLRRHRSMGANTAKRLMDCKGPNPGDFERMDVI